MKRIVLYRYYHKFGNNKEQLKFIKYLNPDIDIYGLYGGPEEQFEEATALLKDELVHNFYIRGKDTDWKWKSSDMTFQLWYNSFGHTVDFDVMHAIEWDLLYFEPIDTLFAHVGENSVALTALIPIKKIQDKWYWTKHPPCREEWMQLMEHFRQIYNYDQEPYGMLGPGESYPRSFLEKIKDTEIPYIAVDELRIPMYAQVFGLKMEDTHFFKKWLSKKEFKYFNANAIDVELKTIEKQLKKKKGRRVFHPFRGDLTFDQLVNLYNLIPKKR